MVRGSPEVRFQKGSTRVPPEFHQVLRGLRGGPGNFHQGSTRVPPGSARAAGWSRVPPRVPSGFARAAGWSGVVSTRLLPGSARAAGTEVPPGFHQGSTRVPPGFHQGSTRVPLGSARAAGFYQIFTTFCEGSGVIRGSTKFCEVVV